MRPGGSTLPARLIENLRGAQWVRAARAVVRLTSRHDIGISFDPGRSLYVTHDGDDHAFSHPARFSKLMHGHHARGRALVYDYLLDRVPFENGDWILDVGANSGDLCLAFRALGKVVNIEAFEPSPTDFAAVEFNLEASSAVAEHRAHRLALWKESSEGMTFYLKSGSADSSLLPIHGADRVVTVPAQPLDDVLAGDTRRFRLLKLEAEGVEPEILEGARSVLPRIDYVAADVGFERGRDQQSTLPEVATLLIDSGFEIVGFEHGRVCLLFRNRRIA